MTLATRKETLTNQLTQHLSLLYPAQETQELVAQVLAAIEPWRVEPVRPVEPLSERDALLITYGDSLIGGGQQPLQNLRSFLDVYCRRRISCVHILPFYPFSSDDGFSVIDYASVRSDLGSWQDVESIAQEYRLMADVVINHVSSQSQWFQEYCQGQRPGYFVEVSSADDLSQVVRPRTTPLVRPTETSDGIQQLWCTFSHDQIDLNFKNPDLLVEFLKIIGIYLRHGARILRLDAIGYLWKESGTTCIHLPQTHELVRLLRNVCEYLAPGTLIITETNVPIQENLTYFGNRNEAHAIYNFSLPPLLVYALLTGQSKHLKHWMMSMPPAPDDCFYLNFTASHDGIGMRPAEGLLTRQEQMQMMETLRKFGGHISTRQGSDGTEHVYEVNISLFDALQGTIEGPDDWGVERFLCSQTVAMGVEGMPAFYIHSMLATPNDEEQYRRTGRPRSLNRHQWDVEQLEQRLADADSHQARVFSELLRRLEIRSRQSAFHPNATQFTLQLEEALFAFWRQSRDRSQSIFAVHNLTSQPQVLRAADLNLIAFDRWRDLLSGTQIEDLHAEIELAPYQSMWLANHH